MRSTTGTKQRTSPPDLFGIAIVFSLSKLLYFKYTSCSTRSLLYYPSTNMTEQGHTSSTPLMATVPFSPDSSLLNSLLHSLPLNVYVKAKDGRFLFVNNLFCHNVGKKPEDILGKADYEVHPGALAQKYFEDDRYIMETREILAIEGKWQPLGKTDFYFSDREEAKHYFEDEQHLLDTDRSVIDKGEAAIDKEGRERWTLTTKTPFYTTKSKHRGTDLGLATVFGIVKQNCGHIWLSSKEGEGTTFRIFFPQASDQESEDKREEPQKNLAASGHENILVVEDESSLQDLAKLILEGHGYSVTTAANGQEALMSVENSDIPFDLLLTDVIMPTMSGRVLADQLSKRFPTLKVLYMSGYTDDANVHFGRLELGIEFIHKPFSPNVPAGKIRSLLDRKT